MIRFNEDWLKSPGMSEWLVRVTNDESKAYCRWCGVILRAHKSDLMTHSATAKHAKNSTLSAAPTGPLNVQIVSTDDPSDSADESTGRKSDSGTTRSQYPKKYRQEWETLEELKDWLQPFPGDNSKAFCQACHVQLRAHKHDLVLHGKSLKHKNSWEAFSASGGAQANDNNLNFITVQFGVDGLGETVEGSSGAKKMKMSESVATEVLDIDNSNQMKSICEEAEILISGDIKQEILKSAPADTIHEIRVPANANKIGRGSVVRKRRMVVSEVLTAIAMNEFTGYELLQIVKAAVPKL